MPKRKLTPAILEMIEVYAEDQYTLEDTFGELNISKSLMKDEQVLQAFEKGQIKLYISQASVGLSDNEIIDGDLISDKQCALWHEQYSDEIRKEMQKREEEKKQATRQFSDPLISGMVNILEQNGQNMPSVSQEVLHDDISQIIEQIQNGDMKALITMLTANVIQLQLFNGRITSNLTGDAGKQLPNFEKLCNMQLKVMSEQRKSIMAINEITNPKRTTFVKEVSQHNHLHQNSEKKDEKQNELQQLEEPGKCDNIPDVEILSLKEKPNEKEFH